MKNLRTTIGVIVSCVLTVGYGLSQYAHFNGTGPAYAALVDCPTVKYLALAVMLAAVGFAFMRGSKEEEGG